MRKVSNHPARSDMSVMQHRFLWFLDRTRAENETTQHVADLLEDTLYLMHTLRPDRKIRLCLEHDVVLFSLKCDSLMFTAWTLRLLFEACDSSEKASEITLRCAKESFNHSDVLVLSAESICSKKHTEQKHLERFLLQDMLENHFVQCLESTASTETPVLQLVTKI